jgi:Family of unknown function (DUF6502)
MTTMKPLSQDASAAERQVEANDGLSATARILLRRTFRILRGCGISEDELRRMAASAVDEVEKTPDAHPSRVTARQAMMCCDVVLAWRRNPNFLDAAGAPAQLNLDNAGNSFEDLVRISAPDADPVSVLGTMEELGVVRISDDRRVELVSDSVVACSGQEGNAIASECVLEHICGFLGSVEFNVFDKPSRAKGRFERACYASLPRDLVPILQQLVNARGQEFVDVIDEWLARRSIKTSNRNDSLLVGAGAYLFVRENFS